MGESVIGIINRMKTTLEIDEGVLDSLDNSNGSSDKR